MTNLTERDHYLSQGRTETLAAGRLLVLLKFRKNPAAPTLGVGISTYADMLDPASTDERRLAACHGYIAPVHEAKILQRHRALEQISISRPMDPYRVELRKTVEGALLNVVSDHLSNAVRNFLLADVPLTVGQ